MAAICMYQSIVLDDEIVVKMSEIGWWSLLVYVRIGVKVTLQVGISFAMLMSIMLVPTLLIANAGSFGTPTIQFCVAAHLVSRLSLLFDITSHRVCHAFMFPMMIAAHVLVLLMFPRAVFASSGFLLGEVYMPVTETSCTRRVIARIILDETKKRKRKRLTNCGWNNYNLAKFYSSNGSSGQSELIVISGANIHFHS